MIPREQVEATQRYRKKRRRIITFSILGAFLLVVLYVVLVGFTDVVYHVNRDLVSTTTPGDWPVFQHDMQRTGVAGTPGQLPQGQVTWTFQTGQAIHSSPAVVGGMVYFGSEDGYVYALDAQTGQLKWKFQTGSWVDGSPIVVNGVLYVGSNDGHMYALDTATGAKIWAFDAHYAVRSTAAYADGVIYFGADDWSIHAVDAVTGKQKWSRHTKNLVLSPPLVYNGIVAIGGMDGYFYCVNAADGRPRLAYPTHALVPGAPVEADGILYFAGSNGYIYAVDPMARNWPLENVLRKYWLASYLYGIAPKPPNLSGYIWSVFSGSLLMPQTGGLPVSVDTTSTMTLAGNTLFVGAGDALLAVNKDTQLKVWAYQTGDLVLSSPAVAGNGVFFGSNDGNVYALDRTTGDLLWQYKTGDQVTSSPALAGNMLYVGSGDGTFYAFK
jgi:outer membrane protein assembly factor BamB